MLKYIYIPSKNFLFRWRKLAPIDSIAGAPNFVTRIAESLLDGFLFLVTLLARVRSSIWHEIFIFWLLVFVFWTSIPSLDISPPVLPISLSTLMETSFFRSWFLESELDESLSLFAMTKRILKLGNVKEPNEEYTMLSFCLAPFLTLIYIC